ncbi:MAG TPA: hypothetical protein VI653_01650, partial [Steroidobacteraceae bacterium]
MQFALIIAGTFLGLLVAPFSGADSPQWFGALLGASIGYAVAQFRALRIRSMVLETEVQTLKERLADVLRRLKDAEAAVRATDAGEGAKARARGPVSDTVSDAGRSQPPLGAVARESEGPRALGPAREPGAWGAAARDTARSTQADSAGSGAHAAATMSGASIARSESVPLFPADSSQNVSQEASILRTIREYFTGGNTVVRVGILILFFGVAFLLR